MQRAQRLALLPLLLLAACPAPDSAPVEPVEGGAAAPERGPVDRVAVQRVESGTLRVSMAASGTVRARRVSEIAAEVSGRLAQVFVDVGDLVEEGQPLFRIDPALYELSMAEARAGLALARAESENAAVEVERVSKLSERRAASEQLVEQHRTAAAVARAQVAQMEARVARAERDLERTLVRAPYAGSIVERRAHEGAMAGPQPILVLQETGSLEAVLAIPDAWPAPVRVGDQVRLHVEGRASPLETRIDRVSDRVDPDTHTYEARAPVQDLSRSLKAGSYLRAEVLTHSTAPAPIVDRSALLMRDGRTSVFRVSGDRVERVAVRVGLEDADRAQILGGIASGDEVVLGEEVGRLEDGARIERIEELSAARARPEVSP
jgi:membrane fusion protein (multidrug efflux system)